MASKKMKMERLSPILPERSGSKTFGAASSSVFCVTPKLPFKSSKDSYSIEQTSSPEIDQLLVPKTSMSRKRRRIRSANRCKAKSSSGKLISSPLSGLLSKKASYLTRDFKLNVNSCESSDDLYDSCRQLSPLAEAHAFDEMPTIDVFSSPKNSTPLLNPSRHVDIYSGCSSFPRKTIPKTSNDTTLSDIVSKRYSTHNKTLSDTSSILMKVNSENDNEYNFVTEPKLEAVQEIEAGMPIECFESPAKTQNLLKFSLQYEKDLKTSFPQSDSTLIQKRKTISNAISCFQNQDELSSAKFRRRALVFQSSFRSESCKDAEVVHEDSTCNSALIQEKCKHIIKNNLSLEIPEISSSSEQSNVNEKISDSETEAVVEGASKTPSCLNRNDLLSGFTMSSSLSIDENLVPSTYSNNICNLVIGKLRPSDVIQGNETQKEILIDKSPKEDCEVKFNLVSEDSTSSNDSFGTIEIGQDVSHFNHNFKVPKISDSPERSKLQFDCAKRNIQIFKSPSKTVKEFSESVNIGVFCSPEHEDTTLNRSALLPNEETAEIISSSTTQEDEFVDESEEIRPRKRMKKGSLSERAGAVISRIDASQSLFDYEMKEGLRSSTGRFVSCPLVICKSWVGKNSSLLLICKPLKHYRIGLQEYCEANLSSIISVVAKKVPSPLSEGSVVLLHFPLTIVYCSKLKIPYVLTGNQLVAHPSESRILDSRYLNVDETLLNTLDPFKYKTFNRLTLLKVFPSNSIKTLTEAALCQNLMEEVIFLLRILHVIKMLSGNNVKKVAVLCCDEENEFCWMEFCTERDVKRTQALEGLHILADGCQVEIKGFYVTNMSYMNNNMKQMVNYCSNVISNSKSIFTLSPIEVDWVISTSGRFKDFRKIPSSFETILTEKIQGKRYFLEVSKVETSAESIRLIDSNGHSIEFIQSCDEATIELTSCSTPFFLDGVYFRNNQLFSDKYTKLIPKV